MKIIKNFAVGLIFVLLFSSFANAGDLTKNITKNIELSETNIKTTIYYQEGDDAWAEDTLNLLSDTFELMEKISGIPYPTSVPKSLYATKDEKIEDSITICELNDTSEECNGSFRIAKNQSTTATIRQIAYLWNTNRDFKKDWLSQGHAALYAYLVLKEIDSAEAEKFKTFSLLTYAMSSADFPLDEWVFLHTATGEKQVTKRNIGMAKSFVFMHLIYKNYPDKISAAREYMDLESIVPDSSGYKKVLEEEIINENLDPLFSGWVFLGDYMVQHEEVDDARVAVQKYNEVMELYNKDPALWITEEELNKYKQCAETTTDPENDCKLEPSLELTDLYAKLYSEGDIKGAIKYADNLVKKYGALLASKDETTEDQEPEAVEVVKENIIKTVSREKYDEARNLYDNRGIFTKIGSIVYDEESNLDMAKIQYDNGNFQGAKKYSERAISDIEKAGRLGFVFVMAVLIIFIIFVAGLFMRR